MFRGAGLLACAFGCAAAPAAELPTPAPLARPAPAAVAPIAPACLPDADAIDVSYLSGDARTIDVCFAPTACFAIDRRTKAIEARTPPSEVPPARAPHRTQPLSFAWMNADVARICAGANCTGVEDPRAAVVAPGRADIVGDDGGALNTIGGDGVAPARFFRVDATVHRINELPITVVAPCADATWLDDYILVTSDDCNEGTPIAMLYDRKGRFPFQVGPGHAIDAHDAMWRSQDGTLAIVAPRSYALVLIGAPARQQTVIDLVPIQADATPTPRFDVASLHDGDWVVASATGGVGVVDHRTTSFARTWIIPRCEASP